MDATLLSLGSGTLICLMPLGMYFLYLSYLNGRVPPTLVRGSWDFVALLLGLSGFIILAGPILLTLMDSTWRSMAFGQWSGLRSVGHNEARLWSRLGTVWFVMLTLCIPLMVRLRRHVTAMYNIAPALVEAQLIETLETLGFPWRRVDNYIEIDPRREEAPDRPFLRFDPDETILVKIILAPATSHAVLKWFGPFNRIRDQVETMLPNVLARGLAARNPIAGWFFVAAIAVMVVMLVWMAIMLMVIMTPVD